MPDLLACSSDVVASDRAAAAAYVAKRAYDANLIAAELLQGGGRCAYATVTHTERNTFIVFTGVSDPADREVECDGFVCAVAFILAMFW